MLTSNNIDSGMHDVMEKKRQVLQLMKAEMTAKQNDAAKMMVGRGIAQQVGSVRERLRWFLPFFAASFVYLGFSCRSTKSWVVLYPLVPMTFAFGYQLDFAYGNKTNRIKGIAEKIMSKEHHMIYVPEWHYTDPTRRAKMMS